VYAYPSEHYPFWRSELPEMGLDWGMFGENLTTEGLDEESVHIGDVFKLGSAQLIVTEPRMPCFKLTIRFEREDIVKRFLQSQKSGLYFGVVQEGTVQGGDRFELLSTDSQRLTVADVTRHYTTEKDNAELLTKAVAASALPVKWREYFEHQLNITAVFLCTQMVGREMVRRGAGGRIVNIASNAAKQASAMGAAYSASK
ncbi:MAG: SDR family NAD(P)-dependent oxidoreductase, partial [Proteobacteria bacterium]|nr:SDR family NAD(P)-dependent oxidoreductase [Pseudomonadota bacterium]